MIHDGQDSDAGESTGPGSAALPVQPAMIGRVYGGSKWAHLFHGSRRREPRETETLLHLNALCMPDGSIADIGDTADPADVFADTAFPLRAGPGVPLGAFLTGALPGIVAQRMSWENGRVACTTPTSQQRDILRRLGLLDGYVALASPVRFQLAVMQAGTPPHPAPANEATLALFAALRAPAATATKRFAILPNREREMFTLRNRASLTAWLRARRIAVLDPDKLSFDGTAAALAEASLLILADPTQAGLIGLCGSSAKVLEITPEGWTDTLARGLCEALSLNWSLLLASAPSYPLLQPLAFGVRVPLSYEVPISVLHHALETVGM